MISQLDGYKYKDVLENYIMFLHPSICYSTIIVFKLVKYCTKKMQSLLKRHFTVMDFYDNIVIYKLPNGWFHNEYGPAVISHAGACMLFEDGKHIYDEKMKGCKLTQIWEEDDNNPNFTLMVSFTDGSCIYLYKLIKKNDQYYTTYSELWDNPENRAYNYHSAGFNEKWLWWENFS